MAYKCICVDLNLKTNENQLNWNFVYLFLSAESISFFFRQILPFLLNSKVLFQILSHHFLN